MKDAPARPVRFALLLLAFAATAVAGCSTPHGGSRKAPSGYRPVASGQAVGHTWQLLRGENGEGISCLMVKVDLLESSADCGMSLEVAPFNVAVQRFPDGSTVAFGIARKEVTAVRVERRGAVEDVPIVGTLSAEGPNFVVVLGTRGDPVGDISSTGPDGRAYSVRDKMAEANGEGA
ncbi:hypothetical protein SAMN05216371_0189 [Streptomyces sp. TLI_053]|uniref:hypothetical protein n=1 Tax=Streptomyces sp. TLI_053 TaxID=1855352 RepID=UPI00087C3A7D|nr:hypothetical protein [Streptomyces sp. TLI_053]SDS57408.1 hypothetical protein SAMN05216371_0189 [Streptomyces sp. TLI_053]